jgi:hypothetical protein
MTNRDKLLARLAGASRELLEEIDDRVRIFEEDETGDHYDRADAYHDLEDFFDSTVNLRVEMKQIGIDIGLYVPFESDKLLAHIGKPFDFTLAHVKYETAAINGWNNWTKRDAS